MSADVGLRERKKVRTRRALVEAAIRLFDEKGYERTTVDEIAAAAEVSPRTFFTYFGSKEDVLFLQAEDRLDQLVEAVAGRGPCEPLGELLLRLYDLLVQGVDDDDELDIALSTARARLLLSEPALRARGMTLMFNQQPRVAEALQRAYPDQLDLISAAAVVGGFWGATGVAGLVAQQRGDSPEEILAAGRRAIEVIVRGVGPWASPRD
ncbi:TetR family transcriptional regulator [Nonomuraea phyllanthi]|uniref:TetR family transcriptional regulator n=1 Tax=Nonomuraea phyllanthi TaxID=2219224 RepID=A0A5C4V261_9ACTN|nr:TetR/AcrR family transcriptional regulator [Nonomuraea phyllanthi]KAB8185193.1 TetR family transcriptional regulator [Nonomuraea phyllanthi]